MPRHLILLRHGKASDERSGGDHNRPLTETGVADAAELRGRLAELDLVPGRILMSDSLRTVETARGIGYTPDEQRCLSLPELYLATAPEIVDAIRNYGGDVSILVVVGHNPGLQTLVQSVDPRVSRVRPGSALVCSVDARLPWHRFSPEAAHALRFLVPGRYSE